MIDSKEKRKKIKDYLDSMDIDFKNFKDEIWTSGNDLGKEGSYLWMTTGNRLGSAELSFSVFDNKKHINPLGHFLQKIESENCLAVFNKFGYGLTLNDDDCFKERYFLCEKLHHHHGGHNHCDDDDHQNHYNENRNEDSVSTSENGESSTNDESWDISNSNDNDEEINDHNQNSESPENSDSWDINDNNEKEESDFDNSSESSENINEDSYFHNTSENEDTPEADSWDSVS